MLNGRMIKNLSINNIYGQRDFSIGDDGCGQMVEFEETAFRFFVSHKQFSEAVEPTMCHLHNPLPRFLCRVSAFVADFLAAAFDVGNVAVGLDDARSRGRYSLRRRTDACYAARVSPGA